MTTPNYTVTDGLVGSPALRHPIDQIAHRFNVDRLVLPLIIDPTQYDILLLRKSVRSNVYIIEEWNDGLWKQSDIRNMLIAMKLVDGSTIHWLEEFSSTLSGMAVRDPVGLLCALWTLGSQIDRRVFTAYPSRLGLARPRDTGGDEGDMMMGEAGLGRESGMGGMGRMDGDIQPEGHDDSSGEMGVAGSAHEDELSEVEEEKVDMLLLLDQDTQVEISTRNS